MNKNSLKRSQAVSAEDHQNQTDAKKGKVEEIHQKSLSGDEVVRSFKGHNIVKLCKKTSSKCYKDKRVSKTGNNLL